MAPGVDHAFFAPGDQGQARRAIRFPAADPMILFVGRIQPLKGLSVAVEALAGVTACGGRLASTTLVVVGGRSGPHGGAEMDRIDALVKRHDLAGRIRFVPALPHEMLSTYFRAADVCVVPSRSESFGLVALEAGACGLPVLASAVGGLTTIVDHGRTGFLLDPLDPGAWSARLAGLLQEPGEASALGRAAARRARDYTWERAAGVLRARAAGLRRRELVACR